MEQNKHRPTPAEMAKGILGRQVRVIGSAYAPTTEEEKIILRLKGYEPSTLDDEIWILWGRA
ncbi:hypothetical protein [Leptothrix discophora]|uniref:Uncharacterized protein n=1 Tax=Leptothrix discophora TaxID=89 RepID=A0ABT9G174_LEPDI|nr:hypothetical protein [Leptothrix discophora]MDP4299943.1 hypothetical protein [Leptothrix discophora]